MTSEVKKRLKRLAEKYENESFFTDDPSQYMYKVNGVRNREAMAFVAAGLSFGSRKQFNPKIEYILELSKGNVDKWIREGKYNKTFLANSNKSFYRFFSESTMNAFFSIYRDILNRNGSLGECLKSCGVNDGLTAIEKIVELFKDAPGQYSVVPKSAKSACKRVCMFLRWMVRDNSCVDLGLWSSFIPKESLVIPLDTHVLKQAKLFGLISSKASSMSLALNLTKKLKKVFPLDPLKADFALFGNGIDKSSE
jgi:uncharacterized protein (TIGR02757 family)